MLSVYLLLPFLVASHDVKARCGKRPSSARVVNGENASPHSWPWQISLRKQGKYHICGGSLIRPDWVVTAAHSVYRNTDPSGYTVVAGAYRRKGTTDVQQTFKLTLLHIHEDFSMRHLKNDIALLQLDRPVKLSDKVSTVCLPNQAPDLKANCYITGWGFVSGWGPSADKLKQAKLPLRSNEDCKKKYQILFDRQVHLCAGEGRIGVSGGCRGDSGGPFVCEKGDNWYLHGAVSFGMSRCTTEYYTVFTRITNYVPWILRKIGEDGTVNTPQPPETQSPHETSPPVRSTVRPRPTGDPGCKDKQPNCAGNGYFCKILPSFRKDCPKTCKMC
ncbi:unnamed protein product [Porites evermanni]|uniref:Peptidase S1 domain-containing protein n=1 Tax=Porites evermanni TaxID=104178 RepID=A0ABN8R8P4_9CNID|nr:unnamed protein product [Porites evermanni]